MLVILAIAAGAAGAALYFAPDTVKEKVLSYVNGSPYIPAEIKTEAENLYATPAMKREKLIGELTSNLSEIQNYLAKSAGGTASSSPEVALVARSRELVNEVLKINADPSAVKQITDALASKVLSSCPSK